MLDDLKGYAKYGWLNLLLPGLGVTLGTVDNASNKAHAVTDSYAAYKNYNDTISKYTDSNVNVKDVINTLHGAGLISESDWKDAAKTIEKYTNNKDNGLTLSDLWYDTFTSNKSHEAVTKVYNLISEKLPEYMSLTGNSNWYNDIVNEVNSNITGAAAPSYFDTDFQGYQMEVTPAKMWTGAELADLHNIDYDPQVYYDLIKQGTKAGVDYANYQNELLNNASLIDNDKKVNSYLDSIRNSKAEALANGATSGAKAAADLLNTTTTLGEYSAEQAALGKTKFNNASSALRADADAVLQARDYFNNLANNLGQDIATLYANDVDREGQQYLSNSQFYAADQALRGALHGANANMYSSYVTSNAAVNAARANATQQANEYNWVYNTLLRANGGDTFKTDLEFNKYLTSLSTNGYYNNIIDRYNANK